MMNDSRGKRVLSFFITFPVVVFIIFAEGFEILTHPKQAKSVKVNTKRPNTKDDILFLNAPSQHAIIILSMSLEERVNSMSDKTIALFDMDGTLTPVRKQLEPDVLHALDRLAKSCRIGVITGSDMAYVVDQMPKVIDGSVGFSDKIDIMPCNGTKRYVFDGGSYKLVSEVNMLEKINQSGYQKIIMECMSRQKEIMQGYQLPYTGTFLQYRGSLLNWCPIGRDAKDPERKAWVVADQQHHIREKYKTILEEHMQKNKIECTVALGGSTSLDIYPHGWDKTFGLTHYPDYFAYFVGDKCGPTGNDWHLYEKLKSSNSSYETHDTSMTIQIIDDIISRISKTSSS